MKQIHPSAIVDRSAEIADGVVIGPFTIVEPNVHIGADCHIGAHVTLGRNLSLGERVEVANYASLGTASQDQKHAGENSYAEIGDDCTIREYATVNRGTREGSLTRVARGVTLLSYAHVAHECVVDEEAIIVNGAQLGGETHIGRRAIVGGLVGVHQFCRVGAMAIVGACSKVTKDIPPFLIADGHPARPVGPNSIGMRRHRFSDEQVMHVRRVFHELFNRHRLWQENLNAIRERMGDNPIAMEVLAFCDASKRGVSHPRQRGGARHSRAEVPIYPLNVDRSGSPFN